MKLLLTSSLVFPLVLLSFRPLLPIVLHLAIQMKDLEEEKQTGLQIGGLGNVFHQQLHKEMEKNKPQPHVRSAPIWQVSEAH